MKQTNELIVNTNLEHGFLSNVDPRKRMMFTYSSNIDKFRNFVIKQHKYDIKSKETKKWLLQHKYYYF